MTKTLCELRKQLLEKEFDHYVELVSSPCFVCKKCGRAANEDRYLCKPRSIVKSGGKKKDHKNFLKLAHSVLAE
jgi:hypothetical protein